MRVTPFSVLLTVLLAIALATPAQASSEPSRDQLRDLESRIDELESWLQEAEGDEDDLIGRLRDAERAIGELNQQLRTLADQTRELNEELSRLSEQERDIQGRLESQQQSLIRQLRAAWMQGDTAALQLMLSQDDPQRLARNLIYYEYLSKHALDRLADFNDTLDELAENRKEAEATREELNETREQTLARRDERADQMEERQQALSQLQARIADRQDELGGLEEDRERLEELLRQAEEALADIEPPEETAPFDTLAGNLRWPLRGDVLIEFGESLEDSRLRNNGIRIGASRGDEVEAVHYGRVAFANWLRGFGLLIILDHGDGYMSLYGNNSSLLHGVGDWVKGGEVIALAGDTGGRSESGVYFEIRHDGQPRDPMNWLRQ